MYRRNLLLDVLFNDVRELLIILYKRIFDIKSLKNWKDLDRIIKVYDQNTRSIKTPRARKEMEIDVKKFKEINEENFHVYFFIISSILCYEIKENILNRDKEALICNYFELSIYKEYFKKLKNKYSTELILHGNKGNKLLTFEKFINTKPNSKNIRYFEDIDFEIKLGNNIKFSEYSQTNLGNQIVIGNNIKIGACVNIENGSKIGNNSKIGNFTEIKSRAIIGHNTKIDDGAKIGENVHIGNYVKIGRKVRIGNSTEIKNNTNINEKTKIGEYVYIGYNNYIDCNVTLNNYVKFGKNVKIGKNIEISPYFRMPNNMTTEKLNEIFRKQYQPNKIYIFWKWVTKDRESLFYKKIKYIKNKVIIEKNAKISDQQCEEGLHVLKSPYKLNWLGINNYKEYELLCLKVAVKGRDILFAGLPGNDVKLRVKKLKVLN